MRASTPVANVNTGQSVYVILKNSRTLSEDTSLVPPKKEVGYELARVASYEVRVYGQDDV